MNSNFVRNHLPCYVYYTMGSGVFIPVHCGGANRHYPFEFFSGYCFTRYLLRGRSFSLCFINRCSVRYFRRNCFLIPSIYRCNDFGNQLKNPLFYYICWCKPNVFSSTLSRVAGHAPTILRLPRFYDRMEYY